MIHPQRLKKETCPVTCPRMVAELCCDYGTSAVVELIRRVLEHRATILAPSVGKPVKSDTTHQLRDELALRRQAIEQQHREILRYRSLVGGPYDIARADLMASLVPEEDACHPRDCSDQRRQQGVCPIDHAPFGAGLIWVIGEGRCDVNSKNPFVGSERGLTQIDSRTKATVKVSEETGNGDDKNHCIEFVRSKLGTTFPDVATDRAFNVLKKLIGKGTGKKDMQAPRWALTKFLILVMKVSEYLASSIVRCRMVDRYKV